MELIWDLLRILLAASLLVFGLYCCYIKSVHMRYDHIPSAPRASFFLGHLPLTWRIIKNNGSVLSLFLQWAEEYGPVLRFNAFHRVTVLILSPEGVKEYLMLPQYPKDRFIYGRVHSLFGVRFVGNGLVTDHDHDHWHKQRRIMDPAFSRSYLIGLMGTFNEQVEELMMELEKKADGETAVDVMDLLRRVTLDIIAKAAFGLELNTLHDDRTAFPQAVTMIMKGIGAARRPFFQYLPWNRKVVKEVRESVGLLRRIGKECIEQRHKAIRNGEEAPLDILTQILKGAAQEKDCDDENMLDNFVTFFVAGHETTANQLSFTVMELARHPDIIAKLQAEVDEVIGVKRDITYEDLGKLEYLSQVLKEILRLYPPVPGTVRWTGKENVIEGIHIPANSTIIFNTYLMGHMERYFKDPEVFNPDRFRKDQPRWSYLQHGDKYLDFLILGDQNTMKDPGTRGKSWQHLTPIPYFPGEFERPYFSYFPFSLGSRSCIGQVFSQMEAKVVMAKFLQRFEFELVPPQSFKILETGTLRPLDAVVCRLKLRRQLGCNSEMKY